MTRRGIAAGILLCLMVAGAGWWGSRAPVVAVSPGVSLQQVLDRVRSGSTIELTPGIHRGPVTIARSMKLVGRPGAHVVAPAGADAAISVEADDVSLEGITVRGGWTGIDLLDAAGATVRDVSVTGSEAQGIRVYKASALIESVKVSGLTSSHAQGIEVLSAPDVTVRGARVIGGKVGIVGHLSEVAFEDNRVSGTTQAGVMIREMSTGVAHNNVVVDALGAGLYCGDESRCDFRHNRASARRTDNSRSGAGWGLVIHYRSVASSSHDQLSGDAGRIAALAGSRLVGGSAVELGDAAAAAKKVALISGASLVALIGLAVALSRLSARLPRLRHNRASAAGLPVAALVLALAVQAFHMGEHVLQVFRVHFDGLPSRGGLAGSVVDNEWAHFAYNAAVLLFIAAVAHARMRGWRPPGKVTSGDSALAAALIVQAYHMVEHTTKVWQHITTGAKVAPGLAGQAVDLVWLHYGVNLVVFSGFTAACLLYAWSPGAHRRAWGRTQPATLT